MVVHYFHSRESAEAVCREIREAGRRAFAVRADVSDEEEVASLAAEAAEHLGRVDVWANVAGYDILTGAGARLPDLDKLERLLAVDVRGTVLCSWAAAERMGEGGVILNTAWDQAVTGHAGGARGREAELYAAAKAAVLGFSKTLARTLAPRVRVNVLAPGWIRTEFYETLDEETRRRIAEGVTLRRWGTPQDVAAAAVFLASDEAAYLTGQSLAVGGGEVM